MLNGNHILLIKSYLLVQKTVLLATTVAWPGCVGENLCTIKMVANHKEEHKVNTGNHIHW